MTMPAAVWRSPEDSARWLPSWLPHDRGNSRGGRGSPATCMRIGARSRVSLRTTNRLARLLYRACEPRWLAGIWRARAAATWQLILYGAGSPAHQGGLGWRRAVAPGP